MAKLYFYYSAMNAGKTTTLLQSAHNYHERGMRTLILTPRLDNRYGAGKVRFPSPVPVGSNLRLGAQLDSVERLPGDGAQVQMTFTFEVEGAPKPACVAEIIFRYYE